jgi:hypothetical protein
MLIAINIEVRPTLSRYLLLLFTDIPTIPTKVQGWLDDEEECNFPAYSNISRNLFGLFYYSDAIKS